MCILSACSHRPTSLDKVGFEFEEKILVVEEGAYHYSLKKTVFFIVVTSDSSLNSNCEYDVIVSCHVISGELQSVLVLHVHTKSYIMNMSVLRIDSSSISISLLLAIPSCLTFMMCIVGF